MALAASPLSGEAAACLQWPRELVDLDDLRRSELAHREPASGRDDQASEASRYRASRTGVRET